MRVLQNVTPTPEQLPIIQRNSPGVIVVRGAAGSGKTTTALLRIKALVAAWRSRFRRLAIQRPVKILVITYNRTLRGYIEELVRREVKSDKDIDIDVKTFAGWARDILDIRIDHDRSMDKLSLLANITDADREFIFSEVQYILGRFLPKDMSLYLDCERRGRGRTPRCERPLRERILNEVIYPFIQWKSKHGITDFYDIAIQLAQTDVPSTSYDVMVIDEAQDLSTNEIRALCQHLETDNAVTFVLDSAQKIYAKGFSWREAGVVISSGNSYRLQKNYRNTRQIAAFIQPILEDVDLGDEDGSLPNLSSCDRDGPKPDIIVGTYSKQLEWAINYLRSQVNLNSESVAFLKPRGGNWFRALRNRLSQESISYVELTRNSEWPPGNTNVALCTMHSAKGLEFDHVIILGLNDEVTPHGIEPGDDQLDTLRRLLAMAVGRSKFGVVIGYKGDEASSLVSYFKGGTFNQHVL